MQHIRLSPLLGFWMLAVCCAGATDGGSPIKIVKRDGGFAISEGDRPVMFYQIQRKAQDGRAARSNYVHPLYDLDGSILTEDFPADHIHHRGIFWAWHQVLVNGQRIQDQWSNTDSFWELHAARVAGNERQAVLNLSFFWQSPRYLDEKGNRKSFVEENTVVSVHQQEGDTRKVDFRIELRALVDGVQIGGSEDDKGYGGFSVRVRLPDDIRFMADVGNVTPLVTPVDASPWMDLTGIYGAARKSGVVILTHPGTAGFPQPWILRSKGSMQNAVYPGRHPVSLPRDKPVLLSYRLVVHRGELTAAQVDRLHAEYARESRQ